MKITKAVQANNGISKFGIVLGPKQSKNLLVPSVPNAQGKGKKRRVQALNTTDGGMQPWVKNVDDDSEDAEIFSRHKDDQSGAGSEQPAEFDGGILFLDAEEALHSIMDDESNY